ncbi:MAG: transcriptional repressor LexA [Clostridia bacterium]|nr:transcriptional repressor LexA [Clostridia bacterium]
MYDDLSKKQIEILEFIRDAVSKKGYPPAVREICEAVGLKSTSTVHGHLTKIEQKGYIKRDPTKPRAIEIIDAMDDSMNFDMSTSYVPVVGQVTAGEPILAVENLEENFPVPSEFLSDGEYFMLRITGDSMVEAGILDKDYVLVRQQQDARNGDTVVALVDDSATVKTFYKEANRIRLQPENATMDPMYFDSVEILGLVKGVFRKM